MCGVVEINIDTLKIPDGLKSDRGLSDIKYFENKSNFIWSISK